MINYQTFEQINYLYDQLHLNNPELTKEALQQRQPDESCTVCFSPIENYNLYFIHFWNWFYITFPASQYSLRTYYHFVQHISNFFPHISRVERLILSIRYTEPVHFDRIVEETFEAFNIYYNFVFDPADIDIIEPSPSLNIPFTTQPIDNNLFEDTSSNSSEPILNTPIIIPDNPLVNYLFNHEDLNLDLLFQENNPTNMMATAQNI